MNIIEFIFIFFIIIIPPTIITLFIYDKREITEKYNKAKELVNKRKKI